MSYADEFWLKRYGVSYRSRVGEPQVCRGFGRLSCLYRVDSEGGRIAAWEKLHFGVERIVVVQTTSDAGLWGSKGPEIEVDGSVYIYVCIWRSNEEKRMKHHAHQHRFIYRIPRVFPTPSSFFSSSNPFAASVVQKLIKSRQHQPHRTPCFIFFLPSPP